MTDETQPKATDPTPDAPADAGAPVDARTADPPPDVVPVMAPSDGNDVELLGLIDRLASLLDRSDLTELEVEAGGTGLILRKPSALATPAVVAPVAAGPSGDGAFPAADESATATREPVSRPSVKAPLTGIFYASPAPGSAPYVAAGGEVAVGQVIGLIEAMKLFNEIKSDLAGRVVRVLPESGTLVKAKQPLIEVEPL
jgi:acetyl-CoA carboxylase biotin carboxyl carrier protein